MDFAKAIAIIELVKEFLLKFIDWHEEAYVFATEYVEDPFPAE